MSSAWCFVPPPTTPTTATTLEEDLCTRLDVDHHPLIPTCIEWCAASLAVDSDTAPPPPPPRFDPEAVPLIPLAWPAPHPSTETYHLGPILLEDELSEWLSGHIPAAGVLRRWIAADQAHHHHHPAQPRYHLPPAPPTRPILDPQRDLCRRLSAPLESLRVALLQRPYVGAPAASKTTIHPPLAPEDPVLRMGGAPPSDADATATGRDWITFAEIAQALGWEPPLTKANQLIPLLAAAIRRERNTPHAPLWRTNELDDGGRRGTIATGCYLYHWPECCGDLRRAACIVAALDPERLADPTFGASSLVRQLHAVVVVGNGL